MALISELVTKVKADTKDFYTKLSHSEKRMVRFGAVAAKVGAGVALAIGTVAVGAFIKLLSVINDTAARIDKLAKTSRKLGVAVEELQFIQFQAQLSGVSIEKLNMGLQRMTRRVSEAAQGMGEAQGALKELGLNAEELAKLSPDKQFAKIGEALKGVSNQADRVRLGFKLFDSEGVDIINAFTGNVQELRDEFDKLGIALTGPQTKAVESYNDSVTKLNTIWEGFRNQLTVAVAPALQKITDFIREQIIEFGGLGPVANKAAKFMVAGLQTVVQAVQGLIDIFNTLQLKILQSIALITKLARVGTLGLSSITGEKLLGIDLEAINKQIAELKSRQSTEFTAPLQKGLSEVQKTLQPQNQKIEVKISAEDGFKATVAESPEVTRAVNKLIFGTTERAE